MNYLKYKKELSSNKDNIFDQKNNDELFGFNYKSYTNIDLRNINMNEYVADILINKIDIKVFEEKENWTC